MVTVHRNRQSVGLSQGVAQLGDQTAQSLLLFDELLQDRPALLGDTIQKLFDGFVADGVRLLHHLFDRFDTFTGDLLG